MRSFRIYLTIGLLINLAACTMVGTGSRTLIKAPVIWEAPLTDTKAADSESFIVQKYPQLLFQSKGDDEKQVVIIDPSGSSKSTKRFGFIRSSPYMDFTDYMKTKYGDPNFEAAYLAFSVRNRDEIPAFLPTDALALVAKNTATIITADSKLTVEQKVAQQKLLEARLVNIPDLPRTTTFHHTDADGREIYYYYPRVEIDFSSMLLSATSMDRFSFLAIIIRLKDQGDQTENDGSSPRIIDFTPKEADFASFTRGQFTQNSQLQARAAYGSVQGSSATTTTNTGSTALTRNLNLGGDLTYTYSEGLVRELKEAIERQTTGLSDKGRIFFAEYRSIRAVRIGGTYSFDLMLEVPAQGQDVKDLPSVYESVPVVKKLLADVYLLGVVRHVYDRGQTGLIFRVPETENDDVYDQVVLKVYKDEKIWEFNEVPWIGSYETKEPTFTLTVLSNREDARFVVKRDIIDETKKKVSQVIGEGSGKKADITLPRGERDSYWATVEFLSIVDTTAKSRPVVLKVKSPPKRFQVPPKKSEKGGTLFVTGNYMPEL